VVDEPLRIYTDGAYSAKHDMGGWGYYVPARFFMGRGSLQRTTNNAMELCAIANAIGYAIMYPADNVIIYTDSQYAIKVTLSPKNYPTNREWINLVQGRLRQAARRGIRVELEWVKGHADTPGNHLADYAATSARDGAVKRLALVKPAS
jgi:ribonuclease HI